MFERAVIRIWMNNPQQFCGSGFLIAPGYVVTAKHVVAHIPYEALYVAGPPWGGQRKLAQPPEFHGHRDVALLKLVKADAQDGLSLAAAPVILQSGQTVTVAGYSTPDQDLELLSLDISSYDGETDALVLHTFIGRGISGGPVLLDNHLVGLLYARETDRNRSYIIPLDVFRDFIQPFATSIGQPKSMKDENEFHNQLINILKNRFKPSELKLLYFRVFKETPEYHSKDELVAELVERAENEEYIPELVALIKKERPKVDF